LLAIFHVDRINGSSDERTVPDHPLDISLTGAPQNLSVASKNSFNRVELEDCASGRLFGPGNAQLPSPPLLMLDRIIDIQASGGDYNRGYAIAEIDVDPSQWFFDHHFKGDPVMPGALLLESLWQLAGFHLAWLGYKGKARLLESGKTRFIEIVEDQNQTLTVSIHIRKILSGENSICIANGDVKATDNFKCNSDSIKIGLYS